tara:strand:+ start:591 stop:1382 length:792 start_codon:yes stop_codon:yes gene_type:complete
MNHIIEGRQKRGRAALEAIATRATTMFGAQAVLAVDGDADRVERIVAAETGIEKQGPSARIHMGTFDSLAAMHLICRWGDALTDRSRAMIRERMTRGYHERGNTENHWLMYYTSPLLATERFTDLDVWWNGLRREVIHTEAERWILGMIDRTASIGHHEYESPVYHGWHIQPMIALADHAEDEHLGNQARQMATLYLADMALDVLRGGFAGGHSRESTQNTWTDVNEAATLIHYYFGMPTTEPVHQNQQMAPTMVAAYQPPRC